MIDLIDIIDFIRPHIKNISGEIAGLKIKSIDAAEKVTRVSLDWIGQFKENKQIIAENSPAQAIITDETVVYSEKLKNKVLIAVDNPKLVIAKIGNEFFVEPPLPGIHPSAVIHPEAKIGKNVFIGPHTAIGKCIIGNNVVIHAGVTIYDNVIIKNNILIHAGAVLGTDGLGCEREKDGKLVKFPHFGGVMINDDVEIGANCQIAKGALSDTVIGAGTKINVGCYIAHNVIIGQNVWISAQAKMAGSSKIEDNATIFIDAIIREQKTIGKGAVIGMGSVVTKDVPAGETWIGNPARKLNK